ncbi:unnamed protein product [Calicophoron daubneyi]|uniref:Uncharacterized protein n=1 Tax=Calicophoron daubneyi TaxID=300641 RepID=A0AAV2TTS5_CALDB
MGRIRKKREAKKARGEAATAAGEEFYPKVSYFSLFRYGDKRDKVALAFGIIFALGVGVGAPCIVLIFKDAINNFTSTTFKASSVQYQIRWFAGLGAIFLVGAFIQTTLMGWQAQRQLRKIRLLYFKAVLRQDVPWHDRQSAGALISKLSQNCENITMGIGTKLSEFLQYMSSFIVGIIIAFTFGWKLTLVACSMLPIIFVVFYLFGYFMKYFTVRELEAYSKASAISGEVLSAIRTVVAFGGERKELERYTKELGGAERVGIKKSLTNGAVQGAILFAIMGASALIFWYGVKLLTTNGEDYTPGDVVLVFMNVVMGSVFLGNALPNFQYFTNAQQSAREIFGTIERVPPIDKDSPGKVLDRFEGNITLKNVKFVYPTRPDITILKNFTLDLKSGQTVALVGPSGSGKSTIVHLLQRFYDPVEGEIRIEGVDIKDLDLKELRNQIGVVQQEPVLFEGTIADNIRLGKPDATQEEIEEAAKEANAHDFICALPEGYDTVLAERGGGMSGGQKQRLAIARALIRKPRLLLLDEATSALDTRSERVVREALEKASTGRTCVVIAHRLTTVRHADLILVLENGVVRESGTHEELIAREGLYAAMLSNQNQMEATREEDEDEEDHHRPEGVWQAEQESQGASEESKTLVSRISHSISVQMKKMKKNPIRRMLAINKPETKYIVGGCIACLISGAVPPCFAVLYSEVYEIFSKIQRGEDALSHTSLISGMMGVVGFVRFVAMLLQGYLFGVSGERLTRRVRSLYYDAMLHQEIGWFDQPDNQPGALTAKLATGASKLKFISGSQIGTIIEAIVTIVVSLIIAFVYSWQLTLVHLAFFPIIIVTGMFQTRAIGGAGVSANEVKNMPIAQEVFSNPRTIFTLTLEDYFYMKYKAASGRDHKKELKDVLLFALVYALSISIIMFSFSAVFSLGAKLVEDGTIKMLALFRCFSVLNMGGHSLGMTASFTPQAKEAAKAAKVILETMDRKSRIPIEVGLHPREPFTGKIEFNRVYFRYPTRPDIRILRNFSHSVEACQTVALVGQSGCGKSTLLQLVQRLYDASDHGPDSGVFFDGHNLRDLDPVWIRKYIGIVSQEPNLFDLSIRDNIAYGDNNREVGMDEIIEAARQANIHEFVNTLPDGYDTIVGPGGSHLSGGQKQRVAIARALVRKPVLLLLDEATSALDNESEKVVQAALDAAMGSRTSLVVAHRLTTVENADQIVVLERGKKIEYGPPAALMEAKGAFYRLHHAEGIGAH